MIKYVKDITDSYRCTVLSKIKNKIVLVKLNMVNASFFTFIDPQLKFSKFLVYPTILILTLILIPNPNSNHNPNP